MIKSMKAILIFGFLTVGLAAYSMIVNNDGDCEKRECGPRKPFAMLSLDEQLKRDDVSIFKVRVDKSEGSAVPEVRSDQCFYDVSVAESLLNKSSQTSLTFKVVESDSCFPVAHCKSAGTEFFLIMEKKAFEYETMTCRNSAIAELSKKDEILNKINQKR